jgi:hypothetical protein
MWLDYYSASASSYLKNIPTTQLKFESKSLMKPVSRFPMHAPKLFQNLYGTALQWIQQISISHVPSMQKIHR